MSFATSTSDGSSLMSVALALAISMTVVVAIAELLARRTKSPRWQRTIWRVAALSIGAIALAECTGITASLTQLAAVGQVRRIEAPRSVAAAATLLDDEQQSLTDAPADRIAETGSAVLADELTTSNSTTAAPIASTPEPAESFNPLASHVATPRHYAPDGFVGAPLVQTEVNGIASTARPDAGGYLPKLLLGAWLFVCFALIGRIVWTRLAVFLFCRKCSAVTDAGLIEQVRCLSARLGLRRRIRFLEARQLTTPVAFGILRPTIVVPAAFCTTFSRRQQDTMLAHELAHLASSDAGWRLVSDLLCALIWWQPLIWWSRRRLNAASERAADEASLLVPGGPRALASCLVSVGRRLMRPRSLAWQSVEGGGLRSGLARRVQSLLEMSNGEVANGSWSSPRRWRLFLSGTALLMAFVILAVSCTAWARPGHTLAQGENSMRVLTNNWRRSLAAAAITAVLIPVIGSVVADDDQRETAREVRRDGDGDRERGEADRPRREGEGDRERGEADRPRREGDRERGEGDRPRREGEGDRERGEGDRPRADRPAGEGERREGDDARRRELQERLEQLNRARAEIEAKGRQLQERLEKTDNDREAAELKEVVGNLRRQHEEIANQIREISQALHGDRPQPDGGDLERRLHHIHAAVENLQAAGLHDQARQLMEAAERLAHAHREGGESAHRPDRPDRPVPPGPPGEVQRLRGEVERLQRQLNEIRGFIHGIVGEREGDERRERVREGDRERDGDREAGERRREAEERDGDRPERRDGDGERDRPRRDGE